MGCFRTLPGSSKQHIRDLPHEQRAADVDQRVEDMEIPRLVARERPVALVAVDRDDRRPPSPPKVVGEYAPERSAVGVGAHVLVREDRGAVVPHEAVLVRVPRRRHRRRRDEEGAGDETNAVETQSLKKSPKMISPLKDIVIATTLGLIAGTAWNSFKDKEIKRTTDFYKFYDAQQAKKAAASDDDE